MIKNTLTTEQVVLVPGNPDFLTAGQCDPVLLQDVLLTEKQEMML
jgi:catalase